MNKQALLRELFEELLARIESDDGELRAEFDTHTAKWPGIEDKINEWRDRFEDIIGED